VRHSHYYRYLRHSELCVCCLVCHFLMVASLLIFLLLLLLLRLASIGNLGNLSSITSFSFLSFLSYLFFVLLCLFFVLLLSCPAYSRRHHFHLRPAPYPPARLRPCPAPCVPRCAHHSALQSWHIVRVAIKEPVPDCCVAHLVCNPFSLLSQTTSSKFLWSICSQSCNYR